MTLVAAYHNRSTQHGAGCCGQLEKQGTGNGNGNGNGERERERTTDGAQNGIDTMYCKQVENALINVRSHVPFTAVTFRIVFQNAISSLRS